MSKPGSSLYQKLSLLYKTTRFPWKKHALIGFDLKGNEYWDCPNPLGGRMKRWVQMSDRKANNDLTVFSQDKLPVQWQAWLRHTRNVAPTINDLVQEERRRALIQDKAKALDQEWTQRKLELQKIQEEEELELARLTATDKAQEQTNKSSQPTGQGDTFVPGEWNPTRVNR
ncbi:hypothetical protein BD770DRAFT_397893 [Pilaira anomala]|nr:hypothetical protein BD770DRAFT_397893 [Pilaira anomala]